MTAVNVVSTELDPESQLWDRMSAGDFLDCYSVEADTTPRRAAEIITTFPNWTKALMQVRRLVTAPFGLSNDGPDATDKLGLFPVEYESETELIAGFNDKHLNFRVSIMARDGRVALATWVHTHNLGGRIYLTVIWPFHVLIARNAVRRVAAQARIDNQTEDAASA
ncbi:MAG: DUF2867 domain-containing protein [Pseudomonadota bacterium]